MKKAIKQNYKRCYFIALLVIIILCLVACSNKDLPLDGTTHSVSESYTLPNDLESLTPEQLLRRGIMSYEPDRKDFPTLEDFYEIKVGLTSSTELVELVGNPLDTVGYGICREKYQTSEGYEVWVRLITHLTDDKDAKERTFLDDYEAYVGSIEVFETVNHDDGTCELELINYIVDPYS